MKILHVIADCNPAKGGAIEGVRRLGDAYRTLGHEQHLLTLDDPSDPWVDSFPSPVFAKGRASEAKRFYPAVAIGWLKDHAGDYDGIVVDGLWNAATLAAARSLPHLGTPYVVFPHGMLDPWFRTVQPAKEWVKRQLFRVNEGPLLRAAHAVLFTTEQERKLARQSWPGWIGISENVVGFGTGEPPPEQAAMRDSFATLAPAIEGRPYLLFLSRIHPKKGCEILLEGFSQIEDRGALQLVIAGPGDDAYCAQLQALAEDLGIGAHVHWPGMIASDAKWGALYGCEAMVLTSYQENFGVVVAEALACRRPVMISDQVNIHDAVSEAEAGLVCATNVQSVTDMLNSLLILSESEREEMGRRGRALYEQEFSMIEVAKRVLAHFN